MFEEAHFQNDDAAREYIESVLWPDGPVCPHCGCTGNITKMNVKRQKGVYQCNDCRKPFTVTIGTVMERSHIPLHKWVQAIYLLCSSKKGMSSHQLHRMLKVTYKTAWFMTHRIRAAMDAGDLPQLGGSGEIVEADETYWGNPKGAWRAWHHKEKIVSLVERNGDARSFHVEKVSGATLRPIMTTHVHPRSRIMTDEASYYNWCAQHFASREAVSHQAKEYSRGEVSTNTVEGFFSILKRGLVGTYHHVDAKHLFRYLDEFDFRYNARDLTDEQRTMLAIKGIAHKRLTYHEC